MRIRKYLGTSGQTADPFMVAEVPDWTVNHRLQGIAYLYVRIKYDRDKFPRGEPSISAIVKGKKLRDLRTGDVRFSTNTVLMMNDYLSDEKYGYAADNVSLVDSDNIAAESSIADEIVDTDNVSTTVSSISTTTDIITLAGDRLKYHLGDRCEVTSTGSLPGGISGGTDYYIIPYQFKGTPRIRLAESLIEAEAGQYIDISTAGSGTITVIKNGEPRYHGGGIIDTEDSLQDNMLSILSASAGRATCVGGKWRILTAAWRAPTLELTEGDLRGSINVRTKISMAERFNTVTGVYVSSLNDFQRSDYPSVRSQTFIDEDYGIEYKRDLGLPFTNRSDTAQRIAKVELLRARQEIVVTTSASLKAMQCQIGDNIMLTFDRYGFAQKEFEVTDMQIQLMGSEIVCNLTLRETGEGVYEWSLSEAEQVDPAPNTTLPSAFNVVVPTGVAFNSNFVDTRDGDAIYSLGMTWAEHPDQFVRNYGDFEVQYKLSSASDWLPSFFVDGELTSAFIVTSSVNVSYDLRIRARNNLGVRSAWVYIYGAVAGSSGGVGSTENWQTFSDSVSSSEDWGTFSDSVSSSEDWGYFT